MKDRNSIVFGIIVFALVIAVIALIVIQVSNDDEGFINWQGPNGEYKIEVVPMNDNITVYRTYVEKNGEYFSYPLRNSPADVQDIYLSGDLVDLLLSKQGIYTTRDLEIGDLTTQKSSIAALEFGKILGTADFGYYQIQTKAAFTELDEAAIAAGLPKVVCEDANSQIGVIYLKLGDSNQVYAEGDCLIVQGVDGDGLIMAADRLAYALLGAM